MKGEHNSRPLNPKIAKACFMAGYIDTWGRGILKIIKACKDAGLPEPDIIEMNGGVEVTIYSKTSDDTTGGQVGGQAAALNTLPERQQEVLKLIAANPKISRKQLAEKLGINESAVQKHTNALKKKSIIERDSETTGQWIIKVKV